MSQFGKIAVLMRTKNNKDLVVQSLKALFSQNFLDFSFYVVDSSSTDGCLEEVKKFPCQIEVIKAKEYIPGRVLNQAIKKIESDIIVFLNSDAVMTSPSSLKNLLQCFIDPNVHAAFGRQIARPDAKAWVVAEMEKSFPKESPCPSWISYALPFAALRKKAWQERPFYTEAWGSEDTEWGIRAKKDGCCILYEPKAAVMHSHNYSLQQLYGRRYIEGEADYFIYGNTYSINKMLWQFIKSVIRDFFAYSKEYDFFQACTVPIYRFVYFWAYYRGFRLGKRRKTKDDTNISIGQNEILKRYDKK